MSVRPSSFRGTQDISSSAPRQHQHPGKHSTPAGPVWAEMCSFKSNGHLSLPGLSCTLSTARFLNPFPRPYTDDFSCRESDNRVRLKKKIKLLVLKRFFSLNQCTEGGQMSPSSMKKAGRGNGSCHTPFSSEQLLVVATRVSAKGCN